ncbi:hypothetical protein GGI05_002664, partial [Coemansia sp. RSA 2603]
NDYLWYDKDCKIINHFSEQQLSNPRKHRSASDADSRETGRKQPCLESADMKHAAGQRVKSVRLDKDDAITDSSDIYDQSSSSGGSNSEEDDDNINRYQEHQMKRRKTAVDRDNVQASN